MDANSSAPVVANNIRLVLVVLACIAGPLAVGAVALPVCGKPAPPELFRVLEDIAIGCLGALSLSSHVAGRSASADAGAASGGS